MYPTLYHFFYGIFGLEIPFLKIIPMLGFWIGVAFLAANWFSARELKRREGLGLIKSTFKIVFLFSLKTHSFEHAMFLNIP